MGKCTQAVWSQKRPIAYQCKVKTCLEVLKSTNMLAGTCPEEPRFLEVRIDLMVVGRFLRAPTSGEGRTYGSQRDSDS